jgi:hypothetical protein
MNSDKDDYEKRAAEVAESQADGPADLIFLAGISWSRANPPPEVEALLEYVRVCSFAGDIQASELVANFNRRKKGEG